MKGYKETLAEGKSPPPFPLLKDSGRIYHHASAEKARMGNSRKTPVFVPTVTCRINQVRISSTSAFIPSISMAITILLN